MKKALLLLLPIFVCSLEVSINTKCKAMRDHAFFPDAKVHNSCVIDDYLQDYIKCRSYYKHNMLNGLNSQGKKEEDDGIGDYTAISNYNYFNKEIKNVLEKEVKKQIAKDQSIMCIVNSEASLSKYEESIAEQEWCYAPKFLSAFDDELMNEHEMKYDYFVKLYNTRSDKLESKKKPKNKTILCGVYLECMSAFINAPHTQVSSGLETLYEKTKKECISSYFTIKTTTNYKSETRKYRPRGASIKGPKVLISSYTKSQESKQVMHIDPKRAIVEIVGFEVGAKNRYNSEADKFDKKQCAFIHKRAQTRVDERLNYSLATLAGHNIFSKNKNAVIKLYVRNNQLRKRFTIPWETLKSNGSWSGRAMKDTFDPPSEAEKLVNNLEATKIIKSEGKKIVESDALEKNNELGRKVYNMGIFNKKQLCTMYSAEFLFAQFSKVDNSFLATIDISISPASKSDIFNFKTYKELGKVKSYGADHSAPSKFEQDPTGILGGLENDAYNTMDSDEQDAWDKAEKDAKKRAKAKKQEAQDKKDAAEFDDISIDDLEMFTE